MKNKVILLILDELGYSCARQLMGNLEGWVKAGKARVWQGQAVLPSVSGPCYASIHTELTPQDHGMTSNYHEGKLEDADIFSAVRAAGGTTAAIAHSFFQIISKPALLIPCAIWKWMTSIDLFNMPVFTPWLEPIKPSLQRLQTLTFFGK